MSAIWASTQSFMTRQVTSRAWLSLAMSRPNLVFLPRISTRMSWTAGVLAGSRKAISRAVEPHGEVQGLDMAGVVVLVHDGLGTGLREQLRDFGDALVGRNGG